LAKERKFCGGKKNLEILGNKKEKIGRNKRRKLEKEKIGQRKRRFCGEEKEENWKNKWGKKLEKNGPKNGEKAKGNFVGGDKFWEGEFALKQKPINYN
jgi:hypothetical protein